LQITLLAAGRSVSDARSGYRVRPDEMTQMNDEQLRALRLLACHPDGCAEAVLLELGFSVGQLAVLVIDGFAKMYRTGTVVGGRQKNVVWMEITEEGRKAIAGTTD
jgi:hypothetical protein